MRLFAASVEMTFLRERDDFFEGCDDVLQKERRISLGSRDVVAGIAGPSVK